MFICSSFNFLAGANTDVLDVYGKSPFEISMRFYDGSEFGILKSPLAFAFLTHNTKIQENFLQRTDRFYVSIQEYSSKYSTGEKLAHWEENKKNFFEISDALEFDWFFTAWKTKKELKCNNSSTLKYFSLVSQKI